MASGPDSEAASHGEPGSSAGVPRFAEDAPLPALTAPTGPAAPTPPTAPAAPTAAHAPATTHPQSPVQHRTFFAHPSEAEFARILDFYAVRWEYEPQVFPILWDLDGNVLESFAPDFYLPDMDLFVEMTTLRQSLVRKKNRKVRRLRELYPSISIKLLYARDFHALLFKYGRTALARELSGTIDGLMSGEGALAGAEVASDTGRAPAGGDGLGEHGPRADVPSPVTIGRSRAARRRAARRAAAASSIPVT